MSIEYNKNLIPNAQALRKEMTPHERNLWYRYLSKCPLRFQRQKVVANYIVDFYCHSKKLVVEIDGGQHYETDQMEYDLERTRVLEQLGMTVIRFTNSDVDRNFREVCQVIEAELMKR